MKKTTQKNDNYILYYSRSIIVYTSVYTKLKDRVCSLQSSFSRNGGSTKLHGSKADEGNDALTWSSGRHGQTPP